MHIRLSQDGTFLMDPFDMHGTWSRNGTDIHLKPVQTVWAIQLMETGKAAGDPAEMVLHLSGDALTWVPAAMKKGGQFSLVFVKSD